MENSIENAKLKKLDDFKQKSKLFFKKYFLEGQKLNEDHELRLKNNENLPFHEKYRKYIAFAIPFIFYHVIWWTLAIRYNIFRLYPTHYPVPLIMILGATIGGATSEGGGAVAFPVMTLLLHIDSTVARDFSLMIQSVGMTASSFTVFWMKVQLEWHSIIFCSLGAFFSIILGLEFIDHLLTGSAKKMLFVSIWFAFACALFMLNRQKKRITYTTIPNFNYWKAIVLIITGFVGGLCSALLGSGVDICSFSILSLLFRISEKVSTPTSIILMAANTLVGFFWRHLIMQNVSQLAWEFFQVSAPVVVICSPFGAFLSSHFHRQVLASFIYILEFVALIGFLITQPSIFLLLIGAGIIIFSLLFFLLISKLGEKLSQSYSKDEKITI